MRTARVDMRTRPYFSNKARSLKQERQVAKDFNGRVQPASGALKSVRLKADVKSRDFLVDCKVTKHGSYKLNLADWRKLSAEAWQNSREPAMCIEFGEGVSVVVLAADAFHRLKNERH